MPISLLSTLPSKPSRHGGGSHPDPRTARVTSFRSRFANGGHPPNPLMTERQHQLSDLFPPMHIGVADQDAICRNCLATDGMSGEWRGRGTKGVESWLLTPYRRPGAEASRICGMPAFKPGLRRRLVAPGPTRR